MLQVENSSAWLNIVQGPVGPIYRNIVLWVAFRRASHLRWGLSYIPMQQSRARELLDPLENMVHPYSIRIPVISQCCPSDPPVHTSRGCFTVLGANHLPTFLEASLDPRILPSSVGSRMHAVLINFTYHTPLTVEIRDAIDLAR